LSEYENEGRHMPVTPNKSPPPPPPKQSIWAPDYIPSGGNRELHAATLAMDYNQGIPPNFDELPPEEQEIIKMKYRYLGIKMRPDIKDKTIPIQKETMDIP
jgi:hypothetical protein